MSDENHSKIKQIKIDDSRSYIETESYSPQLSKRSSNNINNSMTKVRKKVCYINKLTPNPKEIKNISISDNKKMTSNTRNTSVNNSIACSNTDKGRTCTVLKTCNNINFTPKTKLTKQVTPIKKYSKLDIVENKLIMEKAKKSLAERDNEERINSETDEYMISENNSPFDPDIYDHIKKETKKPSSIKLIDLHNAKNSSSIKINLNRSNKQFTKPDFEITKIEKNEKGLESLYTSTINSTTKGEDLQIAKIAYINNDSNLYNLAKKKILFSPTVNFNKFLQLYSIDNISKLNKKSCSPLFLIISYLSNLDIKNILTSFKRFRILIQNIINERCFDYVRKFKAACKNLNILEILKNKLIFTDLRSKKLNSKFIIDKQLMLRIKKNENYGDNYTVNICAFSKFHENYYKNIYRFNVIKEENNKNVTWICREFTDVINYYLLYS